MNGVRRVLRISLNTYSDLATVLDSQIFKSQAGRLSRGGVCALALTPDRTNYCNRPVILWSSITTWRTIFMALSRSSICLILHVFSVLFSSSLSGSFLDWDIVVDDADASLFVGLLRMVVECAPLQRPTSSENEGFPYKVLDKQ